MTTTETSAGTEHTDIAAAVGEQIGAPIMNGTPAA